MAEKSSHFVCRKTLFFLFAMATLFFFLSWFFLLGSTTTSTTTTDASSFIEDQDPNPSLQLHTTLQPDLDPEPGAKGCDWESAVLKVFMYDLPLDFHFGLLDWRPEGDSVWPDLAREVPHYPGGLNLQHSVEYWLTLDLLSSALGNRTGPCAAVRVLDSRLADVVFVPFFSSLSYNRYSKPKPPERLARNKALQERLVKFLAEQEEWKRSGGRDHVILAHHPNSMLESRMRLWPCMFVLSDFGRYPPNVANVEKDVVAPYRHMVRSYANDSSDFDSRTTLMYFQGAIHRKDGGHIREELYRLLRNEKDVHFSSGSLQQNGISQATRGMRSSKFCLNIAGDTPSSNRLFDAIASHCVPVIISDGIELPYEDVLEYSEFCVFVRSSDATKKGYLVNLVRGIGREQWTRMWERLKEVEGMFEYRYPSRKDDAVQMIWQAVARKVPFVRLKLHRLKRFAQAEDGPKRRRRFSRLRTRH
ncbi:putative arabinosyltransferase ARAD1 [Iris pallida]|uniref:Arabinosyltransferase ARAD1 n=1 Tax=Iris pallida TaxID=29817 RepID=A0AAX6F7R5_IRIPA|nr:putative arabinosyltransferase ARAD1 [Iris pallida]KAJ6813452.1 putative arabinosyltransferase ARAD1 [Iris pallida]